jgi:hypothetical protein
MGLRVSVGLGEGVSLATTEVGIPEGMTIVVIGVDVARGAIRESCDCVD